MRKALLALLFLVIAFAACTYPTEIRYVETPAEESVIEEPAPIPEAPKIAEPWIIYVLDSYGKIVYVERVDITNEGSPSDLPLLFDLRLRAWQDEAARHKNPSKPGEPWSVIHGYLYTEPSV